MRLLHKKIGNTLVIRPEGELDMSVAEPFRQGVDQLLEQHPGCDLCLDLEAVSFIDSSGLGVILGRYKKLSATRLKMSICSPRPPVKRILELSGVMRIMPVYDSLEQLAQM
ncbi:MAG: STAS domain-containing protein [Bacillota bacterium]|uniref:Anti-sigma factor antagonist n=2 Tax=Carboxydocella TaxID=178898 RepID=A0A1T4MT48_9FIRM|nr:MULTISPECIES: anti-sigma factor antagonist [Carboxydocella]AVX20341.1 anti-anti-sigma regulatory factor, SpoIIAA [Carboxydocella thermautotrophica]AVX30765.1 anti-anti-sigma regulatory factor, SpoIIAA [Carboxydocella thermautotrophica]SJZ70081.1 anti-anti-sigma regulatory factor, SpoIIAA [Carboxydocella sporoproducens DSM 16521]GAW30088.1 hypothetical protein ULO1_26580 [Carboxydocella sp. ULO1]GAW31171.1 hypothetical protein JDF658_09360 [Carboxydocella sp. JDF658]